MASTPQGARWQAQRRQSRSQPAMLAFCLRGPSWRALLRWCPPRAWRLAVVFLLPGCAYSTCQLPIPFKSGTEPSGVTVGPRNSLVAVSDSGTLQFIDLDDYTVREDTTLNDKYKQVYGWFDLEGVTMTNPESTLLYLGMENKATILEYEWHSSRRIFRRFDLPGFERRGNRGMESLTWVPSDASRHQGYFYVGSQMTGHVYIYELPLLDDTGPEATARLADLWTPLAGKSNVAGMAFSSGYIFVNYDDGRSNRVLIFPILANGLPGALKEQYQVDVADAEGIAVRNMDGETWEVFFSSDARQAVFAYHFRFITGFELHGRCAKRSMKAPVPSAGSSGYSMPRILGTILALLSWLAAIPSARN